MVINHTSGNTTEITDYFVMPEGSNPERKIVFTAADTNIYGSAYIIWNDTHIEVTGS